MIDHTLDPLPRRTPRRAPTPKRLSRNEDGRGWFSSETMDRASHYADVRWRRVLAPALISAGLGLAGLALAPGAAGALLILAGMVGGLISLPAVVMKTASALGHH